MSFYALAAMFLVAGLAFPDAWFQALPVAEAAQQFPVSGMTLFKLALLAEALVLLAWGVRGARFVAVPGDSAWTFGGNGARAASGASIWNDRVLLAIVVLAAVLRVYQVQTDLWLDEIATLDYAAQPVIEQFALYTTPNNHMLNSLLIKLSTVLFGESEWSVRLPAVVFGIATVPVFYWIARLLLGRWPGLLATALLAVSYHHIFFTQNARGYSAYLFFSLLGTVLLVKALREDRLRLWVAYVLVMVLDFMSLLNAVYVAAAHVVMAAMVLYGIWRSGGDPRPMLKRLLWVFVLSALLILHVYALRIPQIVTLLSSMYARPESGFSPLSLDFWRELISGVSAGFGTGSLLAAALFAGFACVGLLILLRRNVVVTLGLLLPGLLTGMHLLAKGMSFTPRFFIYELFLALLAAVALLVALGGVVEKRLRVSGARPGWLGTALVSAVILASAASLIRYYEVPKQSYRAALQALESIREPDQVVVVFHLAEKGIRYYAGRLAGGARDFRYTRSEQELSDILQRQGPANVVIVTTLYRYLGQQYPAVDEMLRTQWQRVRVLPATIGGGQVAIWRFGRASS